jgi:hypothetical protein
MPEEKEDLVEIPSEITLEVPEASECIECRVRVEYVGWDWFTWKRKSNYYYTTQLTSVPLVIDKGIIQSKKVGVIELQARVKTDKEPCNCSATVDGKVTHVAESVDWNTWSFNFYTLIKALASLAIPAYLDLKKLSLGLTGPYGISVLIHTLLLSSIEAKIKEFGQVKENKKVDITCEWTTLVTTFDLGNVPMTRAISAETFENGSLISKILLHFR